MFHDIVSAGQFSSAAVASIPGIIIEFLIRYSMLATCLCG